jgi:hypothetical protein
MARELIYTSAPKGLRPGARGFCTVAASPGMPRNLLTVLESLSGYRHAFGLGDPNAPLNPVVWSHVQITVGRTKQHVLSRVADAGQDYTQRSNKLAHHLVLETEELCPAGPAWILSRPGVTIDRWEGEPRELTEVRSLPEGSESTRICRAWQQVAGDAGWAGMLAQSVFDPKIRQAVVVFQPGVDTLGLVAEAMSLLPPETRWDVSFSTYFTKLPPGVDCKWRFVLEGSPEAKAARRAPQTLFLDLTRPGPRAEGGSLVEAARTGEAPEKVEVELQPAGREGPPPRREPASRILSGPPVARPGASRAEAVRTATPAAVAVEEEAPRRVGRSRWLTAAVVLLLILAGVTVALLVSPEREPSTLVQPPPPVVGPEPGDEPAPPGPSPQTVKRDNDLLAEAERHRTRADDLARDAQPPADALDTVRLWSKRRAELGDTQKKIDGSQQTDVVRSLRQQLVQQRQELPPIDWNQIEAKLQQAAENRRQAIAALDQSQAAFQDAESLLQKMGGSPDVFSLRGQARICSEKIRLTREAVQRLTDVTGQLQTWRALRQWHKGLDEYGRRVDAKIESFAKRDEERERAFDPFQKFPNAVDLPPQPVAGEEHRGDFLGDVPLKQGTGCELYLLGNVIGDGRVFKLRLPPNADQPSDGRTPRLWWVELDPGGGFPSTRIAQIVVGTGKLAFRWESNPPGEAWQLRNCVLQMRSGRHHKSVQLRTPLTEPVLLKPGGGVAIFDIPYCPTSGGVQVQWSLPDVPHAANPMTDRLAPFAEDRSPESSETSSSSPPSAADPDTPTFVERGATVGSGDPAAQLAAKDDLKLRIGPPSEPETDDVADQPKLLTHCKHEVPLAVLELERRKKDSTGSPLLEMNVEKVITFYLSTDFALFEIRGEERPQWQLRTTCYLTRRDTRVNAIDAQHTLVSKFSSGIDEETNVNFSSADHALMEKLRKLTDEELEDAKAKVAATSSQSVAEYEQIIRENHEKIRRLAEFWLDELNVEDDVSTIEKRQKIRKFLNTARLEDLPPTPDNKEIDKCRGLIRNFTRQIELSHNNREAYETRLAQLEALDRALNGLSNGCRMSGRVYVTYPTNEGRENGAGDAQPHEVELLRFVTGTEF